MNKIYLPANKLDNISQIIKESWEIKVRLNQLSLEEPKIISLTGDHGYGKDLWAKIIQTKNPNFHVVKFADRLRSIFHLGGFTDDQIDTLKRKDQKLPDNTFVYDPEGIAVDISGMTMREALVYVAEEVIKPRYGRDFFVGHTIQKIQDLHERSKRIIVTDCRFDFEDRALAEFCNSNKLMLERIQIPMELPKLEIV